MMAALICIGLVFIVMVVWLWCAIKLSSKFRDNDEK